MCDSFEEYEQNILDTCDLFLIKNELGEDIYNEILNNLENQ